MNNTKLIIILTIIMVFLIVAAFSYGKSTGQVDLDCNNFSNRSDAQRVYNRQVQDIYKLDKDRDGVACESLR